MEGIDPSCIHPMPLSSALGGGGGFQPGSDEIHQWVECERNLMPGLFQLNDRDTISPFRPLTRPERRDIRRIFQVGAKRCL